MDSGCGPLGLLTLAVAKACGVNKVIVFDVEESRTKFAESYGADVGIVPPQANDPSKDSLIFSQEFTKEIIEKHDLGHGFDVIVEASGAEICSQMAICALKPGGTCTCNLNKILYYLLTVCSYSSRTRKAVDGSTIIHGYREGVEYQRWVSVAGDFWRQND